MKRGKRQRRMLVCKWCNAVFYAVRIDAETCSPNHRLLFHRSLKAAGSRRKPDPRKAVKGGGKAKKRR